MTAEWIDEIHRKRAPARGPSQAEHREINNPSRDRPDRHFQTGANISLIRCEYNGFVCYSLRRRNRTIKLLGY